LIDDALLRQREFLKGVEYRALGWDGRMVMDTFSDGVVFFSLSSFVLSVLPFYFL